MCLSFKFKESTIFWWVWISAWSMHMELDVNPLGFQWNVDEGFSLQAK